MECGRKVGENSPAIVKSLPNVAESSGTRFGAPTVREGLPLRRAASACGQAPPFGCGWSALETKPESDPLPVQADSEWSGVRGPRPNPPDQSTLTPIESNK